MNKPVNILVTGARGQIGTELVKALRQRYGHESVIASDLNLEDMAYGYSSRWVSMDTSI
jgi:nucleoside-diphosphate-sugar epimerase